MTILMVKNVTKNFGGIKAVDHSSLRFESGKITALIGSNGAGKTTLFNLISGFIEPDEGQILFQDQNIAGLPPWDIARLGIGRLFQDIRLFNRMTVMENILLAFKQKNETPFLSLFARRRISEEKKEMTTRAMSFLEIVGLENKVEELAKDLSYGQQKLLAIVRLLVMDAKVLLLDEPTSGINPLMIEKLLNIIQNLAKAGKTIIISEHNIPVVTEISDRVYFMSEGKIIASGDPQKVLSNPEIKATYIGV